MDSYRTVDPNERTVEASWQYNITSLLCNGSLPLNNVPKPVPSCAKIYLSSIITDSECERKYLIENVYIKLREYCRAAHGIELQVVDLYSGIDKYSGLILPSIADIRRFEIEQCQSTSTGPCFVALLGQRYSDESIPPASISETEFIQRRNSLIDRGIDAELLDKFYKLDENSHPPHYVFLPDVTDTVQWIRTERDINTLLRKSATGSDSSGWMRPPAELQQEIEDGILNLARQKFRDDNCIIICKEIEDIRLHLNKKAARNFIDLTTETNQVDTESQGKLLELVDDVKAHVTNNNIFDFRLKWSEPLGISPHAHRDYLVSVGNTLFEKIRRHVDVCMIEWGHYPNEALHLEVQQHWLHARENLEHFYEQGQHLKSINQYINSQSRRPFIVHGISGCGKSCIMSRIAADVCQESKSHRVVLRHLGSTPASRELEQLVYSLLEQLSKVMEFDYSQPKTFQEAKNMFRTALKQGYSNNSILLVIDGLDRLDFVGYDNIDWLPMELSTNIKMVISVRQHDAHDILLSLKSRYRGSELFHEVNNMLPETCEWILEKRLADIQRNVTHEQWKAISLGFYECPYPIYIELVFQHIRRWRSFDTPDMPHTVPELLSLLIDNLELSHGAILVRAVLSYITCSLYGVSEAELEDILSIDDEVLSLYLNSYNKSDNVQRIPCILWSKLKFDIDPFLSSWKVDGVNVIAWRHRQFSEAVWNKYLLEKPFLQRIHKISAEFYEGLWSGIAKKPLKSSGIEEHLQDLLIEKSRCSKTSHRNVISQPLIVSGHGTTARINVRKLNELPCHLALSDKIHELKSQVLFNYQWMLTKLKAMPMARLLSDFDWIDDTEASLVRQALKDIQEEFDPNILGIELSGRLLPYYSEFPNIRSLIDQCDSESLRRCSVVPKCQLYTSPGTFLQNECDSSNKPSSILQALSVSRPTSAFIVKKNYNWDYAVMENVFSCEKTFFNRLPAQSSIYVTPDQELIICKRNSRIESYQIDSQQREQSTETETGPISCSGISNNHFVFSIKQKTGPFVVDLKFPSQVHRFNHHSTAVSVSECSTVLVCNDGHSLHAYKIPLMMRICSIELDDVASKILFLDSPYKFCVLSSSHYVRLFSVHNMKKVHQMKVLLQEPTIENILLSPNKSTLLIHSKKHLRLYDVTTCNLEGKIDSFSDPQSRHDIVSADFSSDGKYVVACRGRTIGIFCSSTGACRTMAEVPFPCDIYSSVTFKSVNVAVTILENGQTHIWNIDNAQSNKKHMNNFYPGEVSSFSVSNDGKLMVVSSLLYPDAKVVDCDSGNIVTMLHDPFTTGSQPRTVKISPLGKFAVTRCSNEPEGTIDWPALHSDYVWSTEADRVTHFFINSYSMTFSEDDRVLVNIACTEFIAADPSNKLFVASCYKLEDGNQQEHKLTLPDGDLIGEPLVYGYKNWLVCLFQPCIKTKFSGMVMEQRVDSIQLYIFDIFTTSARDRRFINCEDLTSEKSFFINMRETSVPYQVILLYSRGKLPPYQDDCRVDVNYHMAKGLLLYDLSSGCVNHHVPSFLDPDVPAEHIIFSKYFSVALYNFTAYEAKTGVKRNTISLKFDASELLPPVVLLDGNYIAIVTGCHKFVKLLNCRNGVEISHFKVYSEVINMVVGSDDRTLYVSTNDGRVMVLVVVLELCDHVKMAVRMMASRAG